ncbi:MAG: hypothetical protein OEW12_00915 [Deltaproteobacteria bacterium]|nr:hypothetical protein [Deltaproteobacteria bacterium]
MKRMMMVLVVMAAGLWMAGPVMASSPLSACKSCHDISATKKSVMGPPLFGIMGAKPVGAGITVAVWDDKTMDQWLLDSKKVSSQSKMVYKVADGAKRAAIIAALKDLK